VVKEVPVIEDPWVKLYDCLIVKLKKIGMPARLFQNPDWVTIRKSIKYYIKKLHYRDAIKLYKLFDHVHPEFAPPKPFRKEIK